MEQSFEKYSNFPDMNSLISINSKNSSSICYLPPNSDFDIDGIREELYTKLRTSILENEFKVLLENNLIEHSSILSFRFSIFKLSFLFEKVAFRINLIGTIGASAYKVGNMLIENDLLIETNNIFVVLKLQEKLSNANVKITNTSMFRLLKCRICQDENGKGLHFEPTECILKGDLKTTRDTLHLLDTGKDFEAIADNKDIDEFIYIIDQAEDEHEEEKLDRTQEVELVLFPTYSNSQLRMEFFRDLIKTDANLLLASELKAKEELLSTIVPTSSLELSEDLYFKNKILGRKSSIKRSINLLVLTQDDLLSGELYTLINDANPPNVIKTSIIENYLIINHSENIPITFVKNLFEKMPSDYITKEDLAQFEQFAKDEKISLGTKSEICKKLIGRLIFEKIHFDNKDHKSFSYVLNFISSNHLNASNLNFSPQNENDFLTESLDNEKYVKSSIFGRIQAFYKAEVSFYYHTCFRYMTMINDLLSIPTNSSPEIQGDEELEAVLVIYSKLISSEVEDYEDNLKSYMEYFQMKFDTYFTNQMALVDKWYQEIKMPTSGKLEALTNMFDHVLKNMRQIAEDYISKVLELNITLIFSIQHALSEMGYMNDHLAKYLKNIQFSISFSGSLQDYESESDKTLKEVLVSLGISSGFGIAGGLAAFGVARLASMVVSDAAVGTIGGPVGVIAGAFIGIVSFLGTSAYSYAKNKNKLKDLYMQFVNVTQAFKTLIDIKIKEFDKINKEEMSSRISKLQAFVELTVKKSTKI